jgi:uncharacterized protein
MKLSILPGTFIICRLSPQETIPSWLDQDSFWAVTHSNDELSIVCDQRTVPSDLNGERGWKVIQVEGPLDFSLTGVLASLATPLAGAKISIFAISTFDTDYILVKDEVLATVQQVLLDAGFEF